MARLCPESQRDYLQGTEEYEGWLKGVGFKGSWLISSLSLIPFLESSSKANAAVLDIVIVDTHSDINAYKTSGEGIADWGGAASSTQAVSCCQPLNAIKPDRSDSTCCENGSSKGTQKENLENINLNEWVGESYSVPIVVERQYFEPDEPAFADFL
ncbi:MAG: hypothetical protein M1839_004453 [Geoglossum umbratile]|nr:MAG: hypothetical protein M1839_004453 [Geoglossum umbratile]